MSIHSIRLIWDINYSLMRKKEIYDVDNNIDNHYKKLSEYISIKMNKFESARKQYNIKQKISDHEIKKGNKFMTIVTENTSETFRDHLLLYLLSRNLKKQNVEHVYQWLTQEEYDTDAITYDVCTLFDANIEDYINDKSYFDEIKKYYKRYKPDKIIYSFGYRYYYWDFYKNNNKQTNIILQKHSKQIWYDRGKWV
eukprot:410859_1